MVRRLVGFYEYGNALSDLDQLVGLATEEDLEVIDEIISDRSEFDVYLTLPEAFTPQSEYYSTTSPPAGTRGAGNELRKSGLAWITALARVEFGAMVAGFTDHSNPFKDVTPDSHDYKSAMQLLLEGVTGHYAGLSTAPQFTGKGKLKRRDAKIENALPLSRRTRIARAMLAPLLAPGPSEYNPAQAYELAEYQSELDEGQKRVNEGIKMFLAARQTSRSSTSTSAFVEACGIQLRAEQRELAAGTATVRNFARE